MGPRSGCIRSGSALHGSNLPWALGPALPCARRMLIVGNGSVTMLAVIVRPTMRHTAHPYSRKSYGGTNLCPLRGTRPAPIPSRARPASGLHGCPIVDAQCESGRSVVQNRPKHLLHKKHKTLAFFKILGFSIRAANCTESKGEVTLGFGGARMVKPSSGFLLNLYKIWNSTKPSSRLWDSFCPNA